MFKKLLTLSLLLATYIVLINADLFAQQCLDAHNKYRALHGVPAMTLDENIQKTSQQYATYLAENDKFEHSGNKNFGENLYGIFGFTGITGDVPVKAWYDEIKDYDYKNPGFSGKTGHFTQVVWKSSIRLGCAVGKKGTTAIVVANYSPPGNYLGQFPANVLPLV